MDYSGPETLDNEYKEFYLDLDSTILHELDRRDISELIYYKLDHPSYYLNDFFNQSIYNKLNENFLKYFPIYCASFTKSIYNGIINKGIFDIGTNDDGYITGIPFIGIFDLDIINKMMFDIIDKKLCRCIKIEGNSKIILSDSFLIEYFKRIKITIEKIEIDNEVLQLIVYMNLKSLKEKIKQNNINKKENIRYIQSLCKRHRHVKKYSRPLCDYIKIKELMLETIKYIDKYFENDILIKEYSIEQIELYKKQVINEFSDEDKLSEFVNLYEYPNKKLTEVISKAYINPLSFIYWIMQYKDLMTTNKKISINIPVKPTKKPKQHIPLPKLFITFLTNEGNLNAILLKLFPNISLYSIKIEFPKCIDNTYIQFLNPKTKEWDERNRVITFNGPENRP